MNHKRVPILNKYCASVAKQLGLPRSRVWVVVDNTSTYISGKVVVSLDKIGDRLLGYYTYSFYNDNVLSIIQWTPLTDMMSVSYEACADL